MNQNNLQNDTLNALRKDKTPASIFLVSGVRLTGRIESFDNHTLLLNGKNGASQLIYKHAIATVVPTSDEK